MTAESTASERELHPLVLELFRTLPVVDSVWPARERRIWLAAAEHVLALVYDRAPAPDHQTRQMPDAAPESAPPPANAEGTISRPRVRLLPDGRLSRADAATHLGVTTKTLAMWASQGKGPKTIKAGGRAFYFLENLDALKTQP